MNTVKTHLIRHPHARGTRIAYLQQRDAKTKQLQQEIEQAKRVSEFRDSIGWKRPGIIDRMLNALGIGRL